ncbi:DUF2306 domain-containing protein [Gammaproteobacteria bacterium]|nr:DUF2306 domain-containing protein [Gammaproteobacteria bacterium]
MNETLILSLHALPGLLAVILGSIVLLSKKGTKTHKRRGYIWLGLMLLISLTAIFIQEINPGSYSLIHLLIPWTIFSIIFGIYAIKKFKVTKNKVWRNLHQWTMIGLFVGALVIAGAFTLMPGRMLNEIIFG